MEVSDWLRSMGLERYAAAFRENDVDAGLLRNLTADDLRDLGISSVGHRRQLLDAISPLRADLEPAEGPNEGSPSPDAGASPNVDVSELAAERRRRSSAGRWAVQLPRTGAPLAEGAARTGACLAGGRPS